MRQEAQRWQNGTYENRMHCSHLLDETCTTDLASANVFAQTNHILAEANSQLAGATSGVML